ncbi:hypothetical protein COL5a_008770 [Colletotrichum fioriniae]|nr:uncharacterized protein COL516b_006496 [Colletotrichum fioriniae]KAJ0303492.1 hypothetical protein COL516b_006496 [Colletotrichum fioriniae]KAJ0322539.1 hypothetical protein COL5a_008770 [Colletotrichum fioriniae]
MSQNPIHQAQVVMSNNGPQLPQAAQLALAEARIAKLKRIKLVNKITARMGGEMGEQFIQYDMNGNVHPYRFGVPASFPPDPRIQGPSVKYASRYFDSTHLDEAQAKYGGQKHPKGYNIRLKRILGAGGYGFAAHITHKNPQNGFNTDCVIKIEKSRHHGNSALAREEKALWKFVGAQHILQISDITREIQAQRAIDLTAYRNSHPPPPAGARLPDPETQDKNWSLKNFEKQPIRNFLILENANLGDLGLWLSKSSRIGQCWPQRAIWMLFQSLVLGLVDWEYQKPIDEVFPDDPKLELQETVHFDLDPRNVLLANRSMLHGNFPTFKIADFGLTEFFSEYANDPTHFDKEFFWHCRVRGKPIYYAPEQFTSEWEQVNDFIDDDGVNHFVADDGTKPPVAGNYGMHTNIYQVGIIIWCAITLCSFHQSAIRVPYSDAWGRDITTYGGALQSAKFNNIDPELKDLVQRCMAHNPCDRPDLRELVATINNRLARNDQESDDALAAWSQDFFSTPRVPGDEPPRVKREREDEGDDAEGDAGRSAVRRAVDDGSGNPVALDVQRVQTWQQGVPEEPLLLDVFQPPVQPQSVQGNNLLGQSSNNRPVVAPGYPALSPMPMIKEGSSAAAPVFVGLNNQYNQPAAVNPPGGFGGRVQGAPQAQWQPQMPAMQPDNVNNNYMFNYAAPDPMVQNPRIEAQAGLAAYLQAQTVQDAGQIPWNAYAPPGEPFVPQPLIPNIQLPRPGAIQPQFAAPADPDPYAQVWRLNSVHQQPADPAPYAQVGRLGLTRQAQQERQQWQQQWQQRQQQQEQRQQQQNQYIQDPGPSRQPQMQMQYLLQDAQEQNIGGGPDEMDIFDEFVNNPDAMDQN